MLENGWSLIDSRGIAGFLFAEVQWDIWPMTTGAVWSVCLSLLSMTVPLPICISGSMMESRRCTIRVVDFFLRASPSASPEEMIAKMRSWLNKGPSVFEADIWLGEWEWNMSRQEFISAVERVREYIADGDIYQVNLSQRARCSFSGDPVALYQSLRRGNPAPYSAYLAGDDMSLISTSPEQFLRKRGRNLETRPIKGTAPRSDNELANRKVRQSCEVRRKNVRSFS